MAVLALKFVFSYNLGYTVILQHVFSAQWTDCHMDKSYMNTNICMSKRLDDFDIVTVTMHATVMAAW